MEKFDSRKLDHQTREAIRIRAVQRIRAGESPESFAKVLGYHRSCIYDWLKAFDEGDIEALKYKKIPGKEPKLTKTPVFTFVGGVREGLTEE